jgi:hypothetical protein
MSATVRRLALFALLSAGPAVADRPAAADYRAWMREGARQLDRDLEQLQDALVGDAAGPKERSTYRKADAVRDRLDRFRQSLQGEVARADLYRQFDPLDADLEALLKEAADLAAARSPLDRAVRYVRASGDQLHYLVADGDANAGRKNQVIARQARALAAAAADLHRAAEYALDDSPRRPALLADLAVLQKAAERFAGQWSGKAGPKDPKADFEPVNEAWMRVAIGMKRLPPSDAAAFGRAAGRVDQVHERLYRLLAIEGERPRLTIRT